MQPRGIEKPIILLGAPRSGSTIVARCLAMHADLWHLPGEAHHVMEGPLHPFRHGYDSNRIHAHEVELPVIRRLRDGFYAGAINLNRVLKDPSRFLSGTSLSRRALNSAAIAAAGRLSKRRKPGVIRLVEKTPRNTLRAGLMLRLFPDAVFVWLQRAPLPNIKSIRIGWSARDKIGPFRRERYGRAGYPIARQLRLRGFTGGNWRFALVPGWQQLKGASLEEVAAAQYVECNRAVLHDLQHIASEHTVVVSYEAFVHDPLASVRRILAAAELPLTQQVADFTRHLPRVNVAAAESVPVDVAALAALVAADPVASLWADMQACRAALE